MTCFLLRKPRVLPVLWQLHSVVQRNAAHCPQSQVSGVDHSLTCDSRDVVSSTETTTEASHSSVCLSCERLQTPPETFTDHCHTNRVTCWQHSETHSWRNNCKLLQNESCCTWRCLWYKCLQMLLSSCSCVSSQNIVSIIFTLVSSTQGPEEWAHSSTNRQRAGGKL